METLAQVVVTPAGPIDAWAVARVHVQSWRETYAGLLPTTYLQGMSVARHALRMRRRLSSLNDEIVLVAETASGVVGYCAGEFTPAYGSRSAEISTLYLTRTDQRRGIGRRLLAAAALTFGARGAESLELWALNGNEGAFAFYRRCGGRLAGERSVAGWGGVLKESRFHWPRISDAWT